MRDTLNRIGLPVREIVGRIDAPLRAVSIVRRAENAIHHRVAHVKIGARHIDFGAKSARAVWEFAVTHAAEQRQILRNRTGAVGTIFAGFN